MNGATNIVLVLQSVQYKGINVPNINTNVCFKSCTENRRKYDLMAW